MNNFYQISFSSKALSDYLNLLELASNISFNYYQKIYQIFDFHLTILSKNPYTYPIIQSKKNLRRIILHNYILTYTITNHTIMVKRIFSNRTEYMKYI